jgi:thiamine-phosphate pyrophosphorylase
VTICLVTDRRARPPVEQAREAVQGGVDLIQVREPDLEARPLAELAAAIVAVARGSATRVVVNDRLDVAMSCGAGGVHLRGDSIPAGRVRAIVPPGFLVGRSVHGAGEAASVAGDVDYLIAGTLFPTASKPGRTELLGLDGLAAVVRAAPVPVLAIGGITISCADAVAAAGAAGVAAVSLFGDPDRPTKEVVRQLRERFNIGGDRFPRR